MSGFIYIIRNTINNKVYIGQTKVSVEIRWKEHLRHASYGNQVINRAMKKHGTENFYIDVLEECDIKELDSKEIFYIEKYNSTNKYFGYNVSIGGNTPRFKRPSVNLEIVLDLYYNQNYSLDYISKLLGISRYIISTELKNAGKELKSNAESKSKYKLISKEIIEKYLELGKTIRNSAKLANIPYSTFRKSCLYHKVEYNSSKSARH